MHPFLIRHLKYETNRVEPPKVKRPIKKIKKSEKDLTKEK